MSSTLTWIHVGDLHLDEDDGWASFGHLRTIVDEVNEHVGSSADFLFLPGDNANHGTPEQYRRMIDALGPLELPWRIIPGDHDFEPGDLTAYRAAVPADNRPDAEILAGHRCIFLDIVSAGAGGPDFRLTMRDRNRIAEQLAQAAAAGEVPVVFMHAYPGDLAVDGDAVARTFIDGGVAVVDTGHTHYSEVLNDGSVVYAATRSTGQIEEGGGRPGFSIVCVHDRVPSWRFREVGRAWPHVQIVAPCDLRLVTRPADPRQVPRPGVITISTKLFGGAPDAAMRVRVDDAGDEEMWHIRDLWSAKVRIDKPGLHRIEVTCGEARDRIELLVRDELAIPKRRLPLSPGQDCHAIGAWPEAGIEGTQLGPNKNGCGW